MRDDFLVFGSPQIHEEDIAEVVATLRSGWWGTGPKTKIFEELFAEYTGANYAIAVSSCTAGLHLALDVLGIGPGDEVITTPLTFAATPAAIVHAGATPVFVDVDPKTGNIDPNEVARAITPRTSAVIPVHLYGRPCDMSDLQWVANQAGIYVIEDAAHAAEAWYQGMKVGNISDITVFSFYATKNIATGDGGMITTNNEEVAEKMRIKSLHGISKDAWKRYSEEGYKQYDVLFHGYKYNLTDICSSLGIHQLGRAEANLRIREHFWKMYDDAFIDIDVETPPKVKMGNTHARHLYTILTENRDLVAEELKNRNIGTGIHFIALHLFDLYRQYRRGDFPNAEYISDRTLSLPLSPAITENDVNDVIEAVKGVATEISCRNEK
jgi:dTDP-4-amino-4,6-dideoxygalactose transaminase